VVNEVEMVGDRQLDPSTAAMEKLYDVPGLSPESEHVVRVVVQITPPGVAVT
jgi:hypothetical protein